MAALTAHADACATAVEEALQLACIVRLERVRVVHRDFGEPRTQPLEPLARHGVRHAEPLGDLALRDVLRHGDEQLAFVGAERFAQPPRQPLDRARQGRALPFGALGSRA